MTEEVEEKAWGGSSDLDTEGNPKTRREARVPTYGRMQDSSFPQKKKGNLPPLLLPTPTEKKEILEINGGFCQDHLETEESRRRDGKSIRQITAGRQIHAAFKAVGRAKEMMLPPEKT